MPPTATELAAQTQQGSPYAPPDRQELMDGKGHPSAPLLSPSRPELMGQQTYQQAPAYPMQAQEYNPYHNGQQPPQEAHGQPIYEFPGQQDPYEQQPQPPQQARPGWPMAELDGRYAQPR